MSDRHMHHPPSLQARLSELKAGFCARLPGRMSEIQRHWADARDRLEDTDALRELRRAVHSLIGSSASFDFAAIAAAATRVNATLDKLGATSPNAALLRSVELGLQQLTRAVAEAAGEDSVALVMDEPSRSQVSRLVYLLDDDEPTMGQLGQQLVSAGFQVRAFAEPGQLVEAMKSTHPGVLLLGNLPGVAAEWVARFRRQYALPLPLIYVSEQNSMAARLDAVRAGADGFMTKPVDVAALLERLDGLLGSDGSVAARVLIVEDDPDQRALTTAVLQDHGFQVRALSDGRDIERAMTAFQPELLLTDLYMPEIDGNELAALVRLDRQWQHLPVLFLSSESDPAVQLETRRHGGDDFLRKPIAPELLVEAVRLHLERARRRGHLLAAQADPDPATSHDRLLEWLAATPHAALMRLEPAADDPMATPAVKQARLGQLRIRAATHFGGCPPLLYGSGLALVLPGLGKARALGAGQELRDLANQVGLADSAVGVMLASEDTSADRLIEKAGMAVQLARHGSGVHVGDGPGSPAPHPAEAGDAVGPEPLRHSLNEARVQLLFQPMVSLQGDPVEYHEVWARLHPAGVAEGLPPSRFSELLGKGEGARALDRDVLDLALDIWRNHRAVGGPGRLVIRLSAASLGDPELALWVLDSLKARGLSGNCLCFSVDAAMLEDDLPGMAEQLQQLQKLGCELCVAAFPGRQGRALLQQLEPSCVKLQR